MPGNPWPAVSRKRSRSVRSASSIAMMRYLPTCQAPKVAKRWGWRTSLMICKARSSSGPINSARHTNFSASSNPPGPVAFQTSPQPPRPSRSTSRYPSMGSAPASKVISIALASAFGSHPVEAPANACRDRQGAHSHCGRTQAEHRAAKYPDLRGLICAPTPAWGALKRPLVRRLHDGTTIAKHADTQSRAGVFNFHLNCGGSPGQASIILRSRLRAAGGRRSPGSIHSGAAGARGDKFRRRSPDGARVWVRSVAWVSPFGPVPPGSDRSEAPNGRGR